MNYTYTCLNPIAAIGLNNLTDAYTRTEDFAAADAVFVRSAKMAELTPGANLLAVARAGAGVNNIPHADYAKKGIVVFNTPGANANGVKELVLAAMLLASHRLPGNAQVADDSVRRECSRRQRGQSHGRCQKSTEQPQLWGVPEFICHKNILLPPFRCPVRCFFQSASGRRKTGLLFL